MGKIRTLSGILLGYAVGFGMASCMEKYLPYNCVTGTWKQEYTLVRIDQWNPDGSPAVATRNYITTTLKSENMNEKELQEIHPDAREYQQWKALEEWRKKVPAKRVPVEELILSGGAW